jgi:hypothetical protein
MLIRSCNIIAIFSNFTCFSVLIYKIFLLLSLSLKYNNIPFNLLKNYKNPKNSNPLFLALRIKLASIK